MTKIIKQQETKVGQVFFEQDDTEFVVRTESELIFEHEYIKDEQEAEKLFAKTVKKMQIVELINAYTTGGGSGYMATEPCVEQDSYEYIANDILAKWDLK